MHTTVQFGPCRVHWVPVVPGRPREAQRVAQALEALDVTVVACAITPAHLVALTQGKPEPFVHDLFLTEASRRFRAEADEDPYRGAHRWARTARADFETLLSSSSTRPGFLARRRLRRRAAEIPTVGDPVSFLRAYEDVVQRTLGGAEPEARVAACARQLARIVFDEGATRVAALVPATWSDDVLAELRTYAPPSPRDREPPRELARVEEGPGE